MINRFIYNHFKMSKLLFLLINNMGITLLLCILYYIFLGFVGYSEKLIFLERLLFILPVIFQTILTVFILNFKKSESSFKSIKYIMFFYLTLFILFNIYDIIFLKYKYLEDLFETLSIFQYFFQLILLFFLNMKYIFKENIKIPFFFIAPQAISFFTYKISIIIQNHILNDVSFSIFMFFNFINIFNPVLIHVLSSIAKGKLLINGKEI